MPSVPYSGTLQVAPEDNPIPRYNADATPAAFGVNVAQAIEGLGKSAEGVGNEVFARGLAMQDLYNHSEAQEASATYMQKAGELHANYSSLEGKAAVDAYPQYISDLKDARTGLRDGMSNGMSQKLYDSESLSTMGRTIFNGAGHAATQNKQYAVGSSKARVQAIADRTLSTPNDDDAFIDGLSDAEDETRAQGQLQGWGDDQTNEAVAQTTSKLWSQRIQGMAKSQPLQADKLLQQAVKDGDVQGEDISKLTNLVQSANHTVGARMISHDVNTGADQRWGQGPVDIKQAAMAISKIESGSPEGNYNSIGVQTRHGQALGRFQVMEEFLPEFLKQAGMPAMTREEFLKDHAAQDQLFATTFTRYMKQTGSANDAASMWLTGETLANAGSVKDANGTDAKTYVTKFNANLAQGAPLSAKVAMGQGIAQERTPDDPLMQDAVRDRIESDHNRSVAIRRDDEFQNRQVVETSLMGGQDGKLPTTVEEITADPKAEQAWNALLPSTQRRYMGVLARNAKGDHNWTDDTLREYQKIKGIAQADPATFLDQDIVGTDLPNTAKKELINLQGTLKGKAEGDPRVTRALGILAPDMQAAGIDKKNKDDYFQFVGALGDQIQDFTSENKRPPKTDEIKTIGAHLMQAHTSPGRFWGTNEAPTYKAPVPSDEAEKIKQDPTWTKLGIQPTDAQVQRIYTNKLYQDLYGGSTKVVAPVSK